jgi:hypothetical protein
MSALTITKGLTEKCCDCGIALKDKEVDGELIGKIVDYGEHKTYEFDGITDRLPLCSGCLGRMKENRAKDQGDAIMKRKELDKDGAQGGQIKIDVKQVFLTRPLDFTDIIESHDPSTDILPDGTGAGM